MRNLSQETYQLGGDLREKKERKKAACLPCRQRKIRCLGQSPPCATCTARGIEDECEFEPGTTVDPDYIASHVLSDVIDGGGQPQIGNELHDITDPSSSASTVTTLLEPSQNPNLNFSDTEEGTGAEPKLSCILFDQWPGQEISTDVNFQWLTAKYTCLFGPDKKEAHEALHELQQSYHQATPDFRTAVNLFFQTGFVHQLVCHEWRLFADCKDAIDHQDELQHELEFPDIASWCAHSCRGCFDFLLQQRAIRPWYFNSFGHSLFILAFQATDISTMRYLVSQLSPMHLLGPASIAKTRGQKTILQWAASQPDIFSACLFRLEECRLDLRGALDPESFYIICRYATADLADRMYMKGINIAHAVQNDASMWLEIILHHPDPASLLDWLWEKECLPPLFDNNQHSLLEVATQHDRLEAARWLLSQTNDPAEYQKCAMEAAGRQTQASVGIFDCAMRWVYLEDKLNDFSEKAAFMIIYSTCDNIRAVSHLEKHSVETISMRKLMTIMALFEIFFDKSVISYALSANRPRLASILRSF
ncbi:hypothetical protein N7523_010066 [Penicillium sp. IBT 18751x]|nr:hypothetical protein N7523_010066 [Penicillium sp. IBT 18751x]